MSQPTIETLLDELTEAAENRRDANLDADAGEVERESYESEYRSSREAVTQRLAELEAQNGRLFEELLWANDELTRLRSRIAELESLLDRTRNLANANLAEMDAKVSLLEAARNDLLLVVEELNDLRKTAEANALTPAMVAHILGRRDPLHAYRNNCNCTACEDVTIALRLLSESEEKP